MDEDRSVGTIVSVSQAPPEGISSHKDTDGEPRPVDGQAAPDSQALAAPDTPESVEPAEPEAHVASDITERGEGQDGQGPDFAHWIESEYAYVPPRSGGVHEATILSMDQNGAMVHLSETKRDGFVPFRDLERLDDDYRDGLRPGETVPIRITRRRGSDGEIIVSISQGLRYSDWLRADELLRSGEVFTGEVTGHNRGGLIVSFGRLQGFVPNSHLEQRSWRRADVKAMQVGKILSLTVLEVDQRRRRLVLSERLAKRQTRDKVLSQLQEGGVRKGTVRNVADFGVFVDIGGIDGLIHVSELDWSYVESVSDVVKVGDELDVYILSVDRQRQRVGLSRKRLLPNPWERVTENVFPGDYILGTITSIVPFGAFIDVGEGVEGLLHISNMPHGQATHAELQSGATVAVRVLNIDHRRHQIALVIPDAADGNR